MLCEFTYILKTTICENAYFLIKSAEGFQNMKIDQELFEIQEHYLSESMFIRLKTYFLALFKI